MTKTTEELKREMYKDLKRVGSMVSGTHLFETFQESLEQYLEALRQELQQWKDIADERDLRSANLRNKLQAFEFANRSAAELLSEALREPSGLRKSAGSMVHQNNQEGAQKDIGTSLAGYLLSKDECPHANVYKDIAAGPRHYRCSDCGAEGRL